MMFPELETVRIEKSPAAAGATGPVRPVRRSFPDLAVLTAGDLRMPHL
jgi:hypothetical protein